VALANKLACIAWANHDGRTVSERDPDRRRPTKDVVRWHLPARRRPGPGAGRFLHLLAASLTQMIDPFQTKKIREKKPCSRRRCDRPTTKAVKKFKFNIGSQWSSKLGVYCSDPGGFFRLETEAQKK
jgi:hypothetical protein